ncbi:MAG: HAD family phosphatase [Actinomycetales bacterium]|nr:HAD family phosphatase [Actinomycetales bacterium]
MGEHVRLEGLLFDLDGVLVQSMKAHLRAYEEALSPWCQAPELSDLAGRRTEDVVVSCLRPHGCDQATIAQVVKAKRTLAAAYLDELGEHLLTTGAVDLLVQARARGLDLGICTSGSRASIDRFLTLARLSGSDFACLLASEDVSHAKPHPEVYIRACQMLGRDPGVCAVVEDSRSGMAAALAAGCPLIAYRDTSSDVQVPAEALGVVTSLSEVMNFI